MAEKTKNNPRGAGRKPKPDAEKIISFTITARRPVVEAITKLAKQQGLTRGQYIKRVLEGEAKKCVAEGERGRLLGELYAVALAIAKAARGDVARLEKLRSAAIERPSSTFPIVLEICAFELPRVTLANGRETLKNRVADLTVELGFSFPESLTDAERHAFETATESENLP